MEKDDLHFKCVGFHATQTPVIVKFSDDIQQCVEYGGKLWFIKKNKIYCDSGAEFPLNGVKEIRMVCAANGILLVLDGAGKIHSVGSDNVNGRLGRPGEYTKLLPITHTKNNYTIEDDKKFKYITCNNEQCAAITEEGELYVWGLNQDDELGVRTGHIYHNLDAPHLLHVKLNKEGNPIRIIKVGIQRYVDTQILLVLSASMELLVRLRYKKQLTSEYFTRLTNPTDLRVSDFCLKFTHLALFYENIRDHQKSCCIMNSLDLVQDLSAARPFRPDMLATLPIEPRQPDAVDSPNNMLYVVEQQDKCKRLFDASTWLEGTHINLRFFNLLEPSHIQYIYAYHGPDASLSLVVVLKRAFRASLMQLYLLRDTFTNNNDDRTN